MIKIQFDLLNHGFRMGIIAGIFFFATLFAGASMAQSNQSSSSERDQIEDLMTCYAYGSDALARAVDSSAGPDAGIGIFTGCLADDWTMNVVGIEGSFGPELWAQIVYFSVFEAAGVINAQHMIGSVQIDTDGNRATMIAYAIVSLVDNSNVRTQTITYTSEVERRPSSTVFYPFGNAPKAWMLTHTTLEQIAESISPRIDVGG